MIAVPLAFDQDWWSRYIFRKGSGRIFELFEGEYTPGFVIAFAIYNMFFLGGNWAYVQRYTSVKTERDSRKTGWLFGVLYTISPILWMLIPMIYRVYNPSLSGLENEGHIF